METVNLPNNHTQNVCVTWLTILKTLQIPRKHKTALLSTLLQWLCVANEVSRARAFDLVFVLAQSDGGRAAPYRGARACVCVYV